MEGILTYIDPGGRYGKVDTRNDQLKTLFVKFPSLPDRNLINSSIFFDLEKNDKGIDYAVFRSIVSRNNTVFNTEDRARWYDFGENYENIFLEKIEPHLDRRLTRNPEKDEYPWAIDLYDWTCQKYADLKTQTVPFFMVSKYKYKGRTCNPNCSVTFNKKDYMSYKKTLQI